MVCISLLISACHKHHDAPPTPDGVEPETRLSFAQRTELFVETSPLVVARPSRLAIHATHLQGWKPVAAGRVVVELGNERVTVEAPSSPGIFGATLTATSPGERTLAITIHIEGGSERHDLGKLRVFASEAEARAVRQPSQESGVMKFLMEQQWHTAFGVTEAVKRPMRPSMTLFGAVRGRPEGDAILRAPLAGQVARSGGAFPRLGDVVKAGQTLALLQPRFDATIDVGQLARDRARAEATLSYATRERARQEKLAKDGLASIRDLDLAVRDEEIARGEAGASRRVMAVGASRPGTAAALAISAPFEGTLIAVDTAPSSFAERGAQLFRVADLGRLWLELRVPEGDRPRAEKPSGATALVGDARLELAEDAFVTLGGAIDPMTRTAPLVFDLAAVKVTLALGASARARVYTGQASEVVAIPESAIVDDQGQAIVFVQTDGEAFERRVVALGARDGGFVAVIDGLAAGERVVSVGAYSVKLAASSGAVPAHGHAH